MNKIPRYIHEELYPIPYYFSKLELGIEEKQKETKSRKYKKSKKKSKLRKKIKTHRKSIR
jgi:hypothetical protein